jgi:hypothetical protein
MRCERYWREGILLVEQGRPDPHRESCLDCRREHEARGELVRTFKFVGARGGDPWWQERVLRRIDSEPSRIPPWLPWGSALAAACALVVFVAIPELFPGDPGPKPVGGELVAAGDTRQPSFEIIPAEHVVRSTSAGIGDRVRIWVRATQEARIYRGDELILRCTAASAAAASPGCSRDRGGVVAEHAFKLAGDYQLLMAPAGLAPEPVGQAGVAVVAAESAAAEPARSLDRDLAAIMAAGGAYQLHKLPVR